MTSDALQTLLAWWSINDVSDREQTDLIRLMLDAATEPGAPIPPPTAEELRELRHDATSRERRVRRAKDALGWG